MRKCTLHSICTFHKNLQGLNECASPYPAFLPTSTENMQRLRYFRSQMFWKKFANKLSAVVVRIIILATIAGQVPVRYRFETTDER